MKFRVDDGSVEGNQMVMTLSFRLSGCKKDNLLEIVSFLQDIFLFLTIFAER